MGGALKIIPPSQWRALDLLATALPTDVYLAGGVAVATYFGHRTSRDLGLFVSTTDPETLIEPLAGRPEVVITSRSHGTVYAEVAGIPVSLLRYRYPLLTPAATDRLPVPVASVDDLSCMKLSAIASRGAARDFWDLHVILSSGGRSLVSALDDYGRKYASEDVGYVVRSLVYFSDAEAEPRPTGLDDACWGRIRDDFERWVLALV